MATELKVDDSEDEWRGAGSQATLRRGDFGVCANEGNSPRALKLFLNGTEYPLFLWLFDICLVTNNTGSRCGPALQDDDERNLRWCCRHQQCASQRASSRFQGSEGIRREECRWAEHKRRDGQVSDASPLPSPIRALSKFIGFVESQFGLQRVIMAKNLYVGNLPYSTTADDLREAFTPFGTVTRAQVVSDRETGRSRGFGFVEMADGGEQAVEAMNGAPFQGRTLTVNEARPREDRAGGGGGGQRAGGYSSGGGRY